MSFTASYRMTSHKRQNGHDGVAGSNKQRGPNREAFLPLILIFTEILNSRS
jgi:hypothetical protein